MQLVSLITDFGSKDHYAALLKAEILNRYKEVQFVDITHEVDTHDIRQAAYFLSATAKSFPAKTCHIVNVNSFYDYNFEIIIFEYKEQYYLGPNNGVFSLAFDSIDEKKVIQVINDEAERDLFKTIAHGVALINSNLPFAELGPLVEVFHKKIDIQPVITQNEIRATIIHIDKFENIVLNVHREFFRHIQNGREFEIYFKFTNPITSISTNYSEVPIGDVLCHFNSANYLEISINMGKAASQLDLQKDETIQIKFV